MEIRDPVHGSIELEQEFIPIVEHPFFQRLRSIKQLGLSEYIFPGATHTRFLHSIGVMHLADRLFNKIFRPLLCEAPVSDLERLKKSLKLAALLHDIGHAPLSHATEIVMPNLSALGIGTRFATTGGHRQATHEDYTIKAITDSSLTQAFQAATNRWSIDVNCVAELIHGQTRDPDYFTIAKINFFPLLHQLVSGELDCDRMDYLLRDSYFCGVSYGHFDLDWICDNLLYAVENQHAYLTLTERAIHSFDNFLLGRFHMFLTVYFHYRAVCLEQLMLKYFRNCQGEYTIPSDIEAYRDHDDHYLMKILRQSQNPYALQIVANKIPPKILESFNKSTHTLLDEVETVLKEEGIDYIKCSSKSRLSKYYQNRQQKAQYPLKVLRKLGESTSLIDIAQATDLYEKFAKSHRITRLHGEIGALSTAAQEKIQRMTALHPIVQSDE